MLGKPDIVDTIQALVTNALDKSIRDLVTVVNEEDVDKILNGDDSDISVVWISSYVEDPVFVFWQLAQANKLSEKAHIIFTNIDSGKPYWSDLEVYDGGKFGSMYLLTYDANTNVGVKPSQRGILINMKT